MALTITTARSGLIQFRRCSRLLRWASSSTRKSKAVSIAELTAYRAIEPTIGFWRWLGVEAFAALTKVLSSYHVYRTGRGSGVGRSVARKKLAVELGEQGNAVGNAKLGARQTPARNSSPGVAPLTMKLAPGRVCNTGASVDELRNCYEARV
jgi:hypothetical protein